ncbi:MAG: LuxR C-terminal-related transcriptional regulator [Acidobacteria bacterium]|nr:LuxR C-terminal-related transcriptional regulator [Acidobacteriota bacterium]
MIRGQVMGRQDLFERLLESLHACVLDDAEWPVVSGLVDEWCGSRGNSLILAEGTAGGAVDVFFRRFCFRGQRRADLEREYFEDYHHLDERLPRLRELPDAQVTPNSALFTDRERKTSAVFNEVMSRNGTRDGLNVRLEGPDGWRIVWATADPVEGAGWSAFQVGAVERFLPHLRQFARVRQAVVDARVQGASAVEMLGSRRTGVIQLDRRGRVAAANDAALELLRREDGLSDGDGFLRAVVPAEDAELSRLLAQALPFAGGVGASGSMLVSRPRTRTRLELHVSPVDPGRPEERSSRMGALALVVDPARRGAIDVGRVAAILGLTPAESAVAVSLAQGSTIRDIAASTGRSVTTVRWHFRQICAKLGISRQAELVRVVMSLGVPEARGSPSPLRTSRSKPG